MSVKTSLNKVYKLIGKQGIARELGVAYQSVKRWHDQNEMPCTEYNGKTCYSYKIQLLTDGEVTIEDLLGFVPQPQQALVDKN